MEYFRDEYGAEETVFIYTSDDMKWGRRKLKGKWSAVCLHF